MRIVFTLKFLVLIFLTEASVAQDKKEFRKSFLEAEYFFMNEYYEEASFLYQQLLHADPLNYNLHFLLGACYLSIDGQKTKAIPHLEKAVSSISAGYREGSFREKNAPREALFALARAYHINHQFSEAIEYYGKYKTVMKITDTDELDFVDIHIRAVRLAKEQVRDTIDFNYLILGELFNNKNSRAVYAEKDSTMVFMTVKPFYSPIMMSKMKNGVWSDPEIINEDLRVDGLFNVCAISYDGKELYLSIKKEYKWDIFVSYFEDGKWSPVQVLGKEINTEYNETHASITRDKRRLYFTSDRPGGEGARDIYYSDSDEYGKWGKPVNIGKPVNTRYSEETPFVTADGKGLFFSSMGHATIGGFDIFHSTLLPNGKWSSPANIGYPLSSCDDDLFFVPIADGKHALYTSTGGLLPGGRILAVNLDPDVQEPNYLSSTTSVVEIIPAAGQKTPPVQTDDISDEILTQISFVEITNHSVDESTIPIIESPVEPLSTYTPSAAETVSQVPPSEGTPTTHITEGNTIHPASPAEPVSSIDQKSGIDIATPTIAETEINTSPYTDTHIAQATPSEEVTISNTLEMEPVHQTSPAEPISRTDKGSSTDIVPTTASEPSGNNSQLTAESITQAEAPGIAPVTGNDADGDIPEAGAFENDLQKNSDIKISTTGDKPEPENLKNEMEVKPYSYQLILADESSDPEVKPSSYQLILADESSDMEVKPDSYQLILADENIEVAKKSINKSPSATSSIPETAEPIIPETKGSEKQILSSTILFGFDSYRLSESAIATLEQLRVLMSENPDLSVEVTGFTDSMGSFKYNLYLSQKRADQVISYLVSKGIPRDNFSSKAAGMSGYIAKNTKEDGSDNPEGRKFNRRAELYLLNSDHLGIVMEGLFIPEHLRFAARESEISAAQLAGGSFLMANSPAIPDGKMVYTVQLLAMRKTVRKGFFNPSDSIISIKGEDGFTRYITGFFESREEAEKHLEVYVKRGYNDAFISHSSKYAGKKTPFVSKTEEPISYTVQFIALRNPAATDKFGGIENMAVHLGQDGLYRYSAGTFQNKVEAEDYLAKMKERGFRDAFIRKIVNGI